MPASILLSASWMQQNSSGAEQWERVSRLLAEEMMNLWKKWIEIFFEHRLQSNGGHCFAIDIQNLLAILPKWEAIRIEEKDESNQTIESKIRVPNQLSIPLQQFLFVCCKQLTVLVPNTLPRQVTVLLADHLIGELVRTYDDMYQQNVTFLSTSQNASLQFYFDLKCLALLFLGGRRNDELHSLTSKYKANIDPFDFEMFHKYINSNVKTMAQRMQHQYGVLIPNVQHLHSVLATISKQINASTEKDPNVLPLCSNEMNTNWFILLPVVMPSKLPPESTMSKSVSSTVDAKIERVCLVQLFEFGHGFLAFLAFSSYRAEMHFDAETQCLRIQRIYILILWLTNILHFNFAANKITTQRHRSNRIIIIITDDTIGRPTKFGQRQIKCSCIFWRNVTGMVPLNESYSTFYQNLLLRILVAWSTTTICNNPHWQRSEIRIFCNKGVSLVVLKIERSLNILALDSTINYVCLWMNR